MFINIANINRESYGGKELKKSVKYVALANVSIPYVVTTIFFLTWFIWSLESPWSKMSGCLKNSSLDFFWLLKTWLRKLGTGRWTQTKPNFTSHFAQTSSAPKIPSWSTIGTWRLLSLDMQYPVFILREGQSGKMSQRVIALRGLSQAFLFYCYLPFSLLQSFPKQKFAFKCFSFSHSPWNNNIWNHSKRENTFCEINLTGDRKT